MPNLMVDFDDLWESVDVAWPTDYAPLREAIAHLLLDEKLAGYRCTSEQLLTPLNSIGDAYHGREDVLMIDASLIKRAFSKCGDEYSVPYKNLGVKEGGDGVLYCRVDKEMLDEGEGWDRVLINVTDFGYFDSDIAGRISQESPKDHPLDNWSEFRRSFMVSNRVRMRLNAFLKAQQARYLRKKKKKKREREKRRTMETVMELDDRSKSIPPRPPRRNRSRSTRSSKSVQPQSFENSDSLRRSRASSSASDARQGRSGSFSSSRSGTSELTESTSSKRSESGISQSSSSRISGRSKSSRRSRKESMSRRKFAGGSKSSRPSKSKSVSQRDASESITSRRSRSADMDRHAPKIKSTGGSTSSSRRSKSKSVSQRGASESVSRRRSRSADMYRHTSPLKSIGGSKSASRSKSRAAQKSVSRRSTSRRKTTTNNRSKSTALSKNTKQSKSMRHRSKSMSASKVPPQSTLELIQIQPWRSREKSIGPTKPNPPRGFSKFIPLRGSEEKSIPPGRNRTRSNSPRRLRTNSDLRPRRRAKSNPPDGRRSTPNPHEPLSVSTLEHDFNRSNSQETAISLLTNTSPAPFRVDTCSVINTLKGYTPRIALRQTVTRQIRLRDLKESFQFDSGSSFDDDSESSEVLLESLPARSMLPTKSLLPTLPSDVKAAETVARPSEEGSESASVSQSSLKNSDELEEKARDIHVTGISTSNKTNESNGGGQIGPTRGINFMGGKNTQNKVVNFSHLDAASSDGPIRRDGPIEDDPLRKASKRASLHSWASAEEIGTSDIVLNSGFAADLLAQTIDDVGGDENYIDKSPELEALIADTEVQSFEEIDEPVRKLPFGRPQSTELSICSEGSASQSAELSLCSEGSARKSSLVSEEEGKDDAGITDSLRAKSPPLDSDNAWNILPQFSDPPAKVKSNPPIAWGSRGQSSNSVSSEEDGSILESLSGFYSNLSRSSWEMSTKASSEGKSNDIKGENSRNETDSSSTEINTPSEQGREKGLKGWLSSLSPHVSVTSSRSKPKSKGSESVNQSKPADIGGTVDKESGSEQIAPKQSTSQDESNDTRQDKAQNETENFSKTLADNDGRRFPHILPADGSVTSNGSRSKNEGSGSASESMPAGTARPENKDSGSDQIAPRKGSSEHESRDIEQNNSQHDTGSFSNAITTSPGRMLENDLSRLPLVLPADESATLSGTRQKNKGGGSVSETMSAGTEQTMDTSGSVVPRKGGSGGKTREMNQANAHNRVVSFSNVITISDDPKQSLSVTNEHFQLPGESERWKPSTMPREMDLSQSNKVSAKKSSLASDKDTEWNSTDLVQQTPLASNADDAIKMLPLADKKWGLVQALDNQEEKPKSSSRGDNQSINDASSGPSQSAGTPLFNRATSCPEPRQSTGTKSFNRSTSEEKANKNISSYTFIPFRPMLPRELLLGNNLKRFDPTLPLPNLSADTSGSSDRVRQMIAKRNSRSHSAPEISEGGQSNSKSPPTQDLSHSLPSGQFSRGSILKNLYPTMPLFTSPDDVSGSASVTGSVSESQNVTNRNVRFEEVELDSSVESGSASSQNNGINFNIGASSYPNIKVATSITTAPPKQRARVPRSIAKPRLSISGASSMRRISERPEEEEESTTDSTSRAVSLEENNAAGDKHNAVAGDINDYVGDKGDFIIEGVESSSESISKLGSTPISVTTNPPTIASPATAQFGKKLEECRHLSEPPDGNDVTLSSNASSSEHNTNNVSSNKGSPPVPSSTRPSGRVLNKTAWNVSELSLGVDSMYGDKDDHPDLDEKSNDESRGGDEEFRAVDDNPRDANKDSSYNVPTFSSTHTSESDDKKEALDVSDLSVGVDDMYLEMDELFDSERNLNGKSESTSPVESHELQMSSERERAENIGDCNHSELSKDSREGDRGNLDPFNESSSSESYETGIEDDRLGLPSSRLHIHTTRDSMVSALSLSGASALMPPNKQS